MFFFFFEKLERRRISAMVVKGWDGLSKARDLVML